jgi:hypothetical protein
MMSALYVVAVLGLLEILMHHGALEIYIPHRRRFAR